MTYQIIRQAIVDRRCASAFYKDYVRTFCPRAIGKDKSGREIVAVFQYGGGCAGGLPLDGKWSCFRVSAIDVISVTRDAWQTGSLRGRRGGWVRNIDVES